MTKDLRANCKNSIKLFADTYYIKFDIFTQSVAKLLTVMYLLSPSLNKKSTKLLRAIRSLLSGNLVFKVEKLEVQIEVAFLNLYKLLSYL